MGSVGGGGGEGAGGGGGAERFSFFTKSSALALKVGVRFRLEDRVTITVWFFLVPQPLFAGWYVSSENKAKESKIITTIK